VQGYAALAFLTLAILLTVWLPARRQAGDVAGVALMGAGIAIFITEFWRDWEGRGFILRGALDWPQVVAILFVIAGALVLRARHPAQVLPEPPHQNPASSQATHV
jgi:phosphatidylglycerol:prolipoprotein diacylglycerol transferase